ncbi:MAG TPA: type II toxin-antitoxin system RelE/ParE family toxin [Bradyrhizobium sp.]|nr:type II toxin-antitoxin system RelE/ParE family toxin [Bradyrhizobium sp.]
MIRTFRSKALADLFQSGKTAKIDQRMQKRISVRLDTINEAAEIAEINLPGYNFHALSGFNPVRYSIHVNGPWCITFEYEAGDAFNVDFEQYH